MYSGSNWSQPVYQLCIGIMLELREGGGQNKLHGYTSWHPVDRTGPKLVHTNGSVDKRDVPGDEGQLWLCLFQLIWLKQC